MKTFLLICVIAFGDYCQGAETPKRGMLPEDYFALELISDPHLSLDGGLVAFTLGTVDQKRNRRESSIWLASTEEIRAPWQFTTLASSTHARWKPDGKSLAFLSNRAGADVTAGTPARAQVFVLSMSGGEAVQVTDFPDGVSDFEWSPNGRQLACVVKGSDVKTKRISDVRHYLSPIYKFDPSGWYDDKRAHIWSFDLATRSARQITSGNASDDSEPHWSPDGTKIAFVSQDRGSYPGVGGSVSIVPSGGGAAVQISSQNGLAHGPRWADNGKRIAYISTPNDWDDARIWLASAAAGGHSELASRTLDVIPTDLDWVDRDQALVFSALTRGEQQFFRMSLPSGAITPLTSGSRVLRGSEINEKLKRITYVETDAAHLGDVYVSDLSGRNARRLTHANAKLYDEVTFQDAERLRYPAADDFTVEEFFMKPVGWREGKTYPMILLIHGGPGSMWGAEFYHDFQMFAAQGWAVLYVNPRGSSGYGEKFQRAVEKQWGGKTYDDLMLGVDYALQKYPWVDRNRLGVRGASFGGFMTNWIVGHTNRFKAAVTQSSISNFISLEGTRDMAYSHAKDFGGNLFQSFDFYWDQSPLKYAKDVKTPTLVMHGDTDQRIPIEQGEQWFRALKHFGVPAELVVFPRENHAGYALEPKHRVESLKWQIYWFDRYLSEKPSWPAPDSE